MKTHLGNIYDKLGVRRRTDAVRMALQHGLLVVRAAHRAAMAVRRCDGERAAAGHRCRRRRRRAAATASGRRPTAAADPSARWSVVVPGVVVGGRPAAAARHCTMSVSTAADRSHTWPSTTGSHDNAVALVDGLVEASRDRCVVADDLGLVGQRAADQCGVVVDVDHDGDHRRRRTGGQRAVEVAVEQLRTGGHVERARAHATGHCRSGVRHTGRQAVAHHHVIEREPARVATHQGVGDLTAETHPVGGDRLVDEDRRRTRW